MLSERPFHHAVDRSEVIEEVRRGGHPLFTGRIERRVAAIAETVSDRHHKAGARILLALLAGGSAVALLAHAAVQGFGAVTFWSPCWSEGYTSGACDYLQYQAPTPGWIAPVWVWFAEVLLALVVIGVSVAAGSRVGSAGLALVAVLASSLLIDYVFTPAIDGFSTSADNPPGFGLIGAVAQAVAGSLMLRVAIPRRRRSTRRLSS